MDEILFVECVEDCLYSNDDDEALRGFCEEMCSDALDGIEDELRGYTKVKEWT